MNQTNHGSDIFTIYQGPKNSAGVYTYPIFDTFWNNVTLRGNLFVANSEDDRNDAFEEFKVFVVSFSSKLYNFIEVK